MSKLDANLTERDVLVLTWMGQQYAARLNQVQRLFYLFGSEAERQRCKVPGMVSEKTVDERVKKWHDRKLVVREKVYFKQPPWVRLTSRGLDLMGLDYDARAPKLLNHIYWVNQVRLHTEIEQATKGRAIAWVSEREINQQLVGKPKHRIDSKILVDDQTIAVEVELTQKETHRIEAILKWLAAEYSTIWYWVNDVTKNFVSSHIANLPKADRDRFRIYHLNDTLRHDPTVK